MVVQNGFRVSLYNPDTKQPHKEFEKDGATYVEAYPDGQVSAEKSFVLWLFRMVYYSGKIQL